MSAAESELVAILREELQQQRVFLSAEEEEALTRPVTYDNEDDLALDRIRHRRSWLQPVLRNRFIREGRPVDRWRELIAQDESVAGEPTFISSLATHVLEWAARTSDRPAMLGGFVARVLLSLAVVLFLLGAYGWTHGGGSAAIGFIVVAVVVFVAGRAVATRVKRRATLVAEQLLAGDTQAAEAQG